MQNVEKRCESKPGVTIDRECPENRIYKVLDGFLDIFAEFYHDEFIVLLRAYKEKIKKVKDEFGGISISKKMKWKTVGWTWVDVSLKGDIPENVLNSLIDDSYEITVSSLEEDQQDYLKLVTKNVSPEQLFDDIIEYHKLSKHKEDIIKLSRNTILLKSITSSEEDIPIGKTKIGGKPDLPSDIPWPQYQDGKPLAFLTQINLTDISDCKTNPLIPKAGILYFFSVFGWQEPDDSDPDVPKGKYNFNWTKVIYYNGDTKKLSRVSTPEATTEFKASEIDFIPIITYPNDTKEPAMLNLDLKKSVKSKIVDFASTYHSAINHRIGNPYRNLLHSYAEFQQSFVKDVATHNLILLFQLSSDSNSEMCWGDGGDIYFWINEDDLRNMDFSKIYSDYQGG